MIMTSVLGHVKELDFGAEYANWSMTPPDSLFDAAVLTKVAEVKLIRVVSATIIPSILGQEGNCSKFTDPRKTSSNANYLDRLRQRR